jgi:hypothetical protein
MAWQMLPTDYTDAVWAGLKRYTEITNDDGTVSFQDVTQYSNRDNSFFGAQDANRMNEALNTIMSMVENGTDLYTDFQNYFTTQKAAFKEEADSINADFNAYVEDLEAQGDSIIQTIQTDYKMQIETFEDTQEQVFNTWFDMIKGQLSDDVAGNLQNQITDVSERTILLETMCLTNDFISPLATDDDTLTVITDDLGNAIMADWKYKEV